MSDSPSGEYPQSLPRAATPLEDIQPSSPVDRYQTPPVECDNEHSGSSRGLQDTWRCNGESTVNVYYAVMKYCNIPGDVMVKVLSKSTFPHTPGR